MALGEPSGRDLTSATVPLPDQRRGLTCDDSTGAAAFEGTPRFSIALIVLSTAACWILKRASSFRSWSPDRAASAGVLRLGDTLPIRAGDCSPSGAHIRSDAVTSSTLTILTRLLKLLAYVLYYYIVENLGAVAAAGVALSRLSWRS
jgi:hypothetical protein